jgi:hypothetical protein
VQFASRLYTAAKADAQDLLTVLIVETTSSASQHEDGEVGHLRLAGLHAANVVGGHGLTNLTLPQAPRPRATTRAAALMKNTGDDQASLAVRVMESSPGNLLVEASARSRSGRLRLHPAGTVLTDGPATTP